MKQILIVEDDRKLNQGLCLALKDQNLQIVPCFDLKTARKQLACGMTELVLLDLNLPDGSGMELLGEIKAKKNAIPVILLTANDTEMDVVMGLNNGADDYITKPFSLEILRARVKTQLRKCTSMEQNGIRIDNYSFDFERMEFLTENKSVELSKTEQKLLRILIENRGITISREV